MTEPTPRTDALVLKADGVQSIHDADGWHFEPEIEAIITDARSLERSLARKEVLLRDIEAAMRSPGTNMVGLQTLLKRIERELKG
jgi:hypothetical protein